MDVVGLYPSIPIEEGVDAVSSILEANKDKLDTYGLTIEQIRRLLLYILQHNYFRFGNQIYRQKAGVAMGNNLAPPFAILFMHHLESRLLATAQYKPLLYLRYIMMMFFSCGRKEGRR